MRRLLVLVAFTVAGVVAPPATHAAPVEPDPVPVAVSPTPLCVSPSLGPIPCGTQDVCADAVLCAVPTTVSGALPVTGSDGRSNFLVALIALGMLLVGISGLIPARRRARRQERHQ